MLLLLSKCLPRPPSHLAPPPPPLETLLYQITSTPRVEHSRGPSHGEPCGHYSCVLEGYRGYRLISTVNVC